MATANILSSGVAELMSGALKVIGGKGVINFTGDYHRADIYSVDGAHLYTLGGDKSIAMGTGIYMVHVDGAIFKVIVK